MGAINPPRARGYHYECIVAPFVLPALVSVLGQAVERFGEGGALTLLLVPVFALSTSALVVDLKNMAPTSVHRCLEAALQAIPVVRSVSAQPCLHPHVDHRAG